MAIIAVDEVIKEVEEMVSISIIRWNKVRNRKLYGIDKVKLNLPQRPVSYEVVNDSRPI
jgi:hypothetical protein